MHLVEARFKTSSSNSSSAPTIKPAKSLSGKFDFEKLRQERLQRELEERKRLGQVDTKTPVAYSGYQTGFNREAVERLKKKKEKYSDRYRPYDK